MEPTRRFPSLRKSGGFNVAHLASDFCDHLFALGQVSFEASKALAPHSTKGELKESELLQCGIVKILSDTHPLLSTNALEKSDLIPWHSPAPCAPKEYAKDLRKVAEHAVIWTLADGKSALPDVNGPRLTA